MNATPSKPIPGNFASNALQAINPAIPTDLVHLHRGQAFTDSLVIAREFKRKHGNVLRSLDSLIADGTIGPLDFEPTPYLDVQGKKQRVIMLTEAGALIAMPFIGGRHAHVGQARLVRAFIMLREDMMRQQLADWHDVRGKASLGYRVMSSALDEARATQDKNTQGCHYANEAKLVNWAVFGRFGKVERDHLSPTDLALLEAVEIRNALWIAQGRNYAERKADLPAFVQALRLK